MITAYIKNLDGQLYVEFRDNGKLVDSYPIDRITACFPEVLTLITIEEEA